MTAWEYCDWKETPMKTPRTFDTPQLAPWPIGTRVRRVIKDGSKSGRTIDGETIWFDRDGNTGIVVDFVGEPYMWNGDEDSGPMPIHQASVVQFDDDVHGAYRRAIDVEAANGWEVL